jgi:hypothetical protein
MSGVDRTVKMLVGLPDGSVGPLLRAAQSVGVTALLSAGGMHREGRFRPVPPGAWQIPVALDSAGFVAMRQGGYRWSVAEYVEFVATNGGKSELPIPWLWWSSMDYCCEPEIAGNRAVVSERVKATASTLCDVLDDVDQWRAEGCSELADPMPILQGWRPEDYVESIRLTGESLVSRGRSWPALVGVGSVCRRHLHGPTGLIAVLHAIRGAIPSGTRLHLFGVKGSAVAPIISEFTGLIESTDSMAWDFAARIQAREQGVSSTREFRAQRLVEWAVSQMGNIRDAKPSPQLGLFG